MKKSNVVPIGKHRETIECVCITCEYPLYRVEYYRDEFLIICARCNHAYHLEGLAYETNR